MKRLGLIMLLLAGCAQASGVARPTPFGQPPQVPMRRPVHPTATPQPTSTAVPTMTPVPTMGNPGYGMYHVYDLPTSDTCERADFTPIEDAWVMAHTRVDNLAFDVRTQPTWMLRSDYQRKLRTLEAQVRALPEPDCARSAKNALLQELRAIASAFAVYPQSPDAAQSALVNAWAWSNMVFYWLIGNRPWLAIPLH